VLQAMPKATDAPFALEVPAFLLTDGAIAQGVLAAAHARCQLWLKGRCSVDVPRDVVMSFSHQLFDAGEPTPTLQTGQGAIATGLHDLAAMDAALKRGAVAASGWPLGEAPEPSSQRVKVPPEMQVVMELISRIDREEPIEKLEAALKGDPSLAFRLLRYLNSAAFGLRVEITSFRHALMMLGYQKLKRWLALLLASASKDTSQVPVMYAAVRRGLLMDELGRATGDADMRSEMFICGVFSLLDRMLKQPFDELLRSVPMPERVAQALGHEQGPFMPYLALAQAIETGAAYELQERAEALMLGAGEITRATLSALLAAQQLE
jgi:c-di-GMP phosphodiesterase